MNINLKSLYKKQEEIQKMRSQLSKLESEFKQLCETCIEKNYTDDGKYQLLQKFRQVRKVTDPKEFLLRVGDIGWACMSVSVQKADVLKIKLPQDLLEINTTPMYKVVVKS